MPELTHTEVDALQGLFSQIQHWLKGHEKLARELRLDKKFASLMGEGLTLARLCERIGRHVSHIDWPGGHKKAYDLEVTLNDGRKSRLQVKTTVTESPHLFTFTGMKWSVAKLNAALDKKEGKFSLPEDVWEAMEKQIDVKFPDPDTHYWVIVSMSDMSAEFFVLDKAEFKSCIKWHRERYLGKAKHREGSSLGINTKGVLQVRLHRSSPWRERLREHENRFDKLVVGAAPPERTHRR